MLYFNEKNKRFIDENPVINVTKYQLSLDFPKMCHLVWFFTTKTKNRSDWTRSSSLCRSYLVLLAPTNLHDLLRLIVPCVLYCKCFFSL